MTKLNKYTYIDLFAGCGGLSLGLFKSGWKGLFAIEKNEMAFETLKHNLIDKKNHFDWPSWLPRKAHDINNILIEYENELLKLRGKVTLIAGGPPCQGFSIAGRRNENDERNKLVNAYIKFVGIVKPRIVFFENVRGFTSRFKKKDHAGIIYSTLLMDKLGEIGYNVHPDIINFGEYGVPQNRKRFILVGVLDGNAKVFFEELKNKKNKFLKKKGLKEGYYVLINFKGSTKITLELQNILRVTEDVIRFIITRAMAKGLEAFQAPEEKVEIAESMLIEPSEKKEE